MLSVYFNQDRATKGTQSFHLSDILNHGSHILQNAKSCLPFFVKAPLEEKQPACTLGWCRHFCLYFIDLGEVVPYVYALSIRDKWCYIFSVFYFKPNHHLDWTLSAFINVLSAIIEYCWNMHDICTLWLGFWIYKQIPSSILRTTLEACLLLLK